jgi:hypothetical protein
LSPGREGRLGDRDLFAELVDSGGSGVPAAGSTFGV